MAESNKQIIISDSATESPAEELLNSYQWIIAGASIDKGVAERYVEYPRTALDIRMQRSAEGHFDSQPILKLQAILDGTHVAAIEQPPLDDDAPDGDTRGTAAQRKKAERIKSRKEDKEEHSSEDNADQAGIVAPPPAHH